MCKWEPHPCRGRDAARPCKGGGLPSAWRRSRSVRTPLPRRCANGMPRPCRGRDAAWRSAKAAACRQHGDDLGQLARCCRKRTSVRGKGGIPQRPVARAETGSARAKPHKRRALARGRAEISPVPLHLRKTLISECASPRGCSRGSASPAEAAVTAQRDGQRVAVLRPLSLRKQLLLRSATDSGLWLFVRAPRESSVYCATRSNSAATSASLARMA